MPRFSGNLRTDDAKKNKHGKLKAIANIPTSKYTYLLKDGIDNMAADFYTAEGLAYWSVIVT